jgi:hypothetical protein
MRDGQRSGLRTLALVSAVYDFGIAAAMLFFARPFAAAMGAPPPVPLVNAQLNGVFTLALAVGYLWAARDVDARRGYLWVAGVLAKSLGAALFVVDHLREGSPASFLAFAASDGTLALITLALLLRARPDPAAGAA